MLKLVWDSSALINIKEPDDQGCSFGHSLWKDLSDGWIDGPYQNIIPAIAAFEISASVSRKQREGDKLLREFWLMGDNEVSYPIDSTFLKKCGGIVKKTGFDKLRGADLVFACVAMVESAILVTMDSDFEKVAGTVKVLNLRNCIGNTSYYTDFIHENRPKVTTND